MNIYKILITSLLLSIYTYANNTYFSIAHPFEAYDIKSSVSGKVMYTNNSIEGLKSNNDTLIKIDQKLDEIELIQSKRKLQLIQAMIDIENKNFERISKISSKSAFEKDNQKLKVLNLESTKADIHTKIESLKDIISKKTIKDNRYIYSIVVAKDDYVNHGTLLYKAYDLRKAKLIIYLPVNVAQMYKSKTIYIDSNKTDYKIDKIYKVADSKHISSYRCEIIIDSPQQFSTLHKVEFK